MNPRFDNEKKNQLYEILIKNLKEEEEEEETLIFWNKVLIQPSDAIYIFFLIKKKKAKTEFKSIENFKSNVKPYRLPKNMSKSVKKEQSKLR